MIVDRLSAPPVLLIGAVRGLYSESDATLAQLDRANPDHLGLALSPEEYEGIGTYFSDAEAETTIHLIETEKSEIQALTRWGEVRVPNPTAVRAIEWARRRSVPIHPLDPPDEGAAAMFTASIGYVELVRRTLRERSLARAPPSAESPDDFALQWDRRMSAGSGSRDLARNRDSYLVAGAREVLTKSRNLAVIVDRERFELVRSLFRAPADRP